MMTVTVCVIAYNEEKTLPRLLEDIKQQDYPAGQMEILLIDSCSEDGTMQIMQKFAEENQQYIRVTVAENRKRILPAGWNVALKLFQEEVILRIDAHARIPSDFVRKNVECLESGEYVSGGPRPNLPEEDTPWQRMLLLAESSMFGSGIASFRRETKKKYVKSMFHPAYRREVFEKAGTYDERLVRTEDNEMNYRIRECGFRLCYDPSIHSWQYTRSTLKKMLRQKYANGYWVALTLKICPKCMSVYHFVPFIFMLAVIGSTVLALFGKSGPAKILWGTYGVAAAGMSMLAVKGEKKHPFQLLLPGIFLLLHGSYGIGSLVGLLKLPFWDITRGKEISDEDIETGLNNSDRL